MKDNKQTTSHSFFVRTILKEQGDLLENKKSITITLKSIKNLFIQVWKTEMYCN